MSEDAPPETPPETPHADDGLDLARVITRSLRGAGAPATRRTPAKRRRRTGESTLSGAHPDDRDPQLLEGLVERLVAEHGWEASLRDRGLFARWPELVGEEIARHVTPESLQDGKLVVRTDSTAWATQLRLLVADVVRRLNTELGDGTVRVIDVLGPHAPTWRKGRLSVRDGRGPRDTYG